jgi:hypothetical protein
MSVTPVSPTYDVYNTQKINHCSGNLEAMKLVTSAITSNVDVLVSNPRKVLRVDTHHFKPVAIMKPHAVVVKTGRKWEKGKYWKLRLTNTYINFLLKFRA